MEVITIETTAYKQLISELSSLKELVTSMAKNTSPTFKLYSEEELAKLLNVTTRHLQNCRKKGELSCSNIGRRVVYTQEHVDEFLKNKEQKAYRYRR